MAKSRARKLADIIVGAGVDIDGNLTFDGGSTSADLTFADNDKANFGDASDLQIYHDSSHSYIQDAGSGNLYLRANGTAVVIDDGTNNLAAFNVSSGEAALYYGGSGKKLATTSTGIDVTGTIVGDGLTVDGAAEISSTTPTLRFFETDQTDEGTLLRSAGDSFQIAKMLDTGAADGIRLAIDQSSGDFSLFEDTGTTAKFFWDASTERLGLGTTTPSQKLDIRNSGSAAAIKLRREDTSDEMLILIGSSYGYVQNTTGPLGLGGSGGDRDLFIATSGNIGIGTTSPAYKLQVNGSGIVARFTDGTSHMDLYSGSNLTEISTVNPLLFSVGSTERMRIDSSGRVGIGTSSPAYPLDVSGPAGDVVRFTGDANNSMRAYLGSGYQIFQCVNSGTTNQFGYVAGEFFAQTANTERMRIDSSGNVGIGTDSPSTILHAKSASPALLLQDSSQTGRQTQLTQASGIAKIRSRNNASNGQIVFEGYTPSTTSEYMRIDASGNVGIGSATANHFSTIGTTNVLGVKSTSGGLISIAATGTNFSGVDLGTDSIRRGGVYSLDGSNLAFYTNATNSGTALTERMRINSSGNVGIGTSPFVVSSYRVLHVQSENASAGGLIRLQTNAAAEFVDIFNYNDALYKDANTHIFRNKGGSTEYMRINTSGNIGIGTDSPFAKSHIVDTGWSSGAPYGTVQLIEGNDVNDNNWGHLVVTDTTTTSGNGGAISFATGTSSALNPFAGIKGVSEGSAYGGIGLFTRANGGTATERMRINSSGNVGIGVTDPQYLLHMNGGASRTDVQVTLSGYGVGATDGAQFGIQTQGAYIWNFENTDLYFATNNQRRLTINEDGNVGINTQSPAATLHTVANSGTTALLTVGASGNNIASFYTSGSSQVMTLDASGNLLVGKTAQNLATEGISINPLGYIQVTEDQSPTLYLNRLTTDGSIVNFYKDGTSVGSIANDSTSLVVTGSSTGLKFGSAAIWPTTGGGVTNSNGAKDLGASTVKFKDLYLNGYAYVGALKTNASVESVSNLTFWVANVGEAARIEQGTGNIGVGTSAPSFSAVNSVSSGIKGIEIFKNGTDTASAIKLAGDNGSGTKAFAQIGYSGANATAHFANFNTSGTQVGEIVIGSTGNVGIGTTSPSQKLHVNGRVRSGDGLLSNAFQVYNTGTAGFLIELDISPSDYAHIHGTIKLQQFNVSSQQIIDFSATTINNGTVHTYAATADIDVTIKLFVYNSSWYIHVPSPSTYSDISAYIHLGAGYQGDSRGSNCIVGISSAGVPSSGVSGSVDIVAQKRVLANTAGNVGIGETSPNAKFHVKDTLNSTGVAGSATPIVIIQNERLNTGSGTAVLRFDTNEVSGTSQFQRATIGAGWDGSGNYKGFLAFATNDTNNALQERMRIRHDGNVGIGTTSPLAALHVDSSNDGPIFDSGGTGNTNHALLVRDSANNQLLRVNNNGDIGFGTSSPTSFGGGNFEFSDTSSAQTGVRITSSAASGEIGVDASGLYLQSITDGDGLSFYTSNGGTANVYAMRIRHDGNVGIGTTSPSFPLEISGAGTVSLAYQRTGTGVTAKKWGFHSDNSNTYWQNITDNVLAVTVSNAGNVGIGETDPDSTLTVKGSAHTNFQVKSNSESTKAFIQTVQDSDVRIGSSTNHPVAFYQNGSERMRIDASGNVGINQSSPTRKLHVTSAGSGVVATFGDSLANNTIEVTRTTTNASYIGLSATSAVGGIIAGPTFTFSTSNSGGGSVTERMRLDSSGNLLVNTTSQSGQVTVDNGGNNTGVYVLQSSSSINHTGISVKSSYVTGGQTGTMVRFIQTSDATVGTISSTITSTAYNTSSDQRLKNNIVDAPSASDDIDAIQVRSFDWKADGSHQKYGMVAQELQSVAPEAVSEGATEEDMMGVDYSKLVPMLVKEIQSLRARVAELEGE